MNQPTTERIPERREGVAPSTPSSGDETTSPNAATRRLIDLSHTIEAGMITYKGLPAPMICDYLSREASRGLYAEGTEFHIGRIEMVANTGTYIDAPFHRFADGADMSELELASLADLPGVVVRVAGWERPGGRDARAIGPDVFEPYDVRGRAVLVHTGWAAHWRTDRYFEGHPYLTEGAAVFLRDHGAVLVGIDSYNIDDTADPRRPVHTILLGAGIPIVEHMRGLEQLPVTGFRFSAVPVKVKGLGSFPVRAYARLEADQQFLRTERQADRGRWWSKSTNNSRRQSATRPVVANTTRATERSDALLPCGHPLRALRRGCRPGTHEARDRRP
ncbi:MAG: cyclase family protein [Gemmatimonadota bacterium]